MDITYLGHSCFRLKGRQGIVVTDPFDKQLGFSLGPVTADVVTVSHDHFDHNFTAAVKPASAREKPFIINMPGEYEVSGISVFGHESFHDDKEGGERGVNTIFSIHFDGLNIVHLGDLGHALDEKAIEKLGDVDVLLCPIGGVYTIDSKTAIEIIQEIEPSYIIPMHYNSTKHDQEKFGKLETVEAFEKQFGVTVEPVKSLSVSAASLPEQTTLSVLTF